MRWHRRCGFGPVLLFLDTEALCLELSPTALSFLKRNLDAYPQYHVQVQKADVLLPDTTLRFSHGALDFIASNPPYIEREELSQLQPEGPPGARHGPGRRRGRPPLLSGHC